MHRLQLDHSIIRHAGHIYIRMCDPRVMVDAYGQASKRLSQH